MRGVITGQNGFIGQYLQQRLNLTTVEANNLPHGLTADYFFHFGSPSSNVLFEEDKSHVKNTIDDFIKVVEYCKKKHIKLVFPSSANVYTNLNSYSHTKSALEQIALAYELPFVAFRIFAGYGIGEEHKKDYSSIVYQWIKQMIEGNSPTIWGDGEQTRDFIYIDDIVENIVDNLDNQGVIDIGTGVNTPFNRVLEIINKNLGTNINPTYVGKPSNYVQETICNNPVKNFVIIEEGIERIICHLKS